MPDSNSRHPASDPETPEGLPSRETKHEDESVVNDLASDMENATTPSAPKHRETTAAPERQRTIRQRRSRSRSHWNLDQQDEPQKTSRGPGFGWILGVGALICTTLGGIIVFAVAGVSQFLPASGGSRTLQMALYHLEQGDMNSARQFIGATPADQRTSPYFFSLVTRMAIAHNDAAAANQYLQQGLDIAPDDPLMLIAKAEVELAEGNFDTAIATAEKAISIDPELNIAWRVLGRAKFAKKDTEGALEALKKSLEIAPSSVMTITTTVQLYMSQEDSESASRLFRTSLESHPNPDLSITFAGFLVQRGDDDAAAAAIDEALKRNPRHARLLSFRARLHLRAKNFTSAQEALREATAAEPKIPDYWIELGNAYGADERYLDAGNAFKRALELDPNNPSTVNNLGYSLLLQKQYNDAEACFQDVLSFEPNHLFAHQNLIRLYEETFQEEKAEEYRKKAEEINSKALQQQPPAPAPQ